MELGRFDFERHLAADQVPNSISKGDSWCSWSGISHRPHLPSQAVHVYPPIRKYYSAFHANYDWHQMGDLVLAREFCVQVQLIEPEYSAMRHPFSLATSGNRDRR